MRYQNVWLKNQHKSTTSNVTTNVSASQFMSRLIMLQVNIWLYHVLVQRYGFGFAKPRQFWTLLPSTREAISIPPSAGFSCFEIPIRNMPADTLLRTFLNPLKSYPSHLFIITWLYNHFPPTTQHQSLVSHCTVPPTSIEISN